MSAVDESTLGEALRAAARGWPVLPLHARTEQGTCSCGSADCEKVGKHPIPRHGLKEATTDQSVIEAWWSEWPSANLGVVTGPDSFFVLDIDPRHGGDESLRSLEVKHGKLPDTVEVLTGGGGRHLYFAWPEGGVRTRVGFLPGLDSRGPDAYVVLPSSVHGSGARYQWELSSHPDEVPLAEAPAWLLEAIGLPRAKGGTGPREDEVVIPEGRRSDTLASLAGTMRRRSMTPEAIRAALQAENIARCRPPLSAAEVDQIAASISSYAPDPGASVLAHRPEICVTARQDRELLEEARAALHRASPGLVYRDPGRLMRVDGVELCPVSGGWLHDRLAQAASWTKMTDDGPVSTPVPRRLIDPLLNAPGLPIPSVRRVIRVPAFVGHDYRLMSRPGIDGDTLFLGEPLDLDPIPEEPTPEELQSAIELLTTWLEEFVFSDETSRAHALGLLVTLLIRAAIPGRIPMFGIEASTAGTGKTTLAEELCTGIHGEPPVPTTWTRDGEEMGKRAASWALGGNAVVLLDDVARITGDPAHILSSLITTGAIQVRAMRELASAGGRWDGILIFTGNNVAFDEEMPRKICRIRLLSPEDPWTRTFERKDLRAWTVEHRAEIVRAVAVLVAAWKAIGRPPGPRSRPTFHPWAQAVGGILGCVSGALQGAFLDPKEVADMLAYGEGVDDLRAFVEAWAADVARTRSVGAADLVGVAEAAGVLGDVLGDGNPKSRASKLGRYLRAQREKVVAGFRIVGGADATAKAMRWKLVPATGPPGGAP